MKRFLLLMLLQIVSLPTLAAVFVVTSNADSGPGTLREAITLAAANNSAEKDRINFNIADISEAGRTITLLSSLPELSSSIIIDGSTQPGSKIGISNAKIILTIGAVANPAAAFTCFSATAKSDIEIDGFYFNGIALPGGNAAAISFNKSLTIIIGRAGKGNVFGNVDMALSLTLCTHNTISANLFGINPKTSLPAISPYSTNLAINSCSDLKIGGDIYMDGNTFVKSNADHPSVINNVDNCTFKCNIIGYKTNDGGAGHYLKFNSIGTLYVISNVYNYGSATRLANITKLALIRANRTNLGTNLMPDAASTSTTPFELEAVKKALIGGTDPQEANVINNTGNRTGDYPAIDAYMCSDIQLQRNIINCKTSADAYTARASKVTLPVISITSVNDGVISGKATPGAEVEVYSDSQCQLCEPTTYLGSAIASASGLWTYIAARATSGFTASATLAGRTSAFVKVGYDAGNVVITDPSCGQQNGSIKGIKVLNSTKTEWADQTGKVIGTDLDIDNLAPGTYTFKAYLGPNCSTKSLSYTLKGVVIDDTKKTETDASCFTGKGAITNIKVMGATTYQWVNNDNEVVATTLDLTAAPPGKYHLVASNGACSQSTPDYTINQQVNTTGYNYSGSITDATCGFNNGSIKLLFSGGIMPNNGIALNNAPHVSKPFRWVNHNTGLTIATEADAVLTGMDAGTYDVYITNGDGCERLLNTYTIKRIVPLVVNNGSVQTTPDNCETQTGSVKGVKVTGTGPFTFSWTNTQGATVATTTDLLNVAAGTYHLKVTDGLGCEQGFSYVINHHTATLPSPAVKELKICSAGEVILSVADASSQYNYRLYDNISSTTPLAEEKSGKFKVTVKANRSYYISAFIGTCESSRAELKVSMGMSGINMINAFSPNGDGINDTWTINGIEIYPRASVQVFARSGGKVFESTGYATPFNGTYNGQALPAGAYYYIINPNTGCNFLSGTLTLIR